MYKPVGLMIEARSNEMASSIISISDVFSTYWIGLGEGGGGGGGDRLAKLCSLPSSRLY